VSELSEAQAALEVADKEVAAAIKKKKTNRAKDQAAIKKVLAVRDPLRQKVMTLGAAERAADPNQPPAQGVSN